MKKTAILTSILITSTMFLSSCVKSHTCECKLNDFPDVIIDNHIIVGTKKAAKSSCENKSSVSGGYTCFLK